MKLKRDEFRKLRQGGMNVTEYLHKFMELSRYAPEDINDDEKKQEAFLGGLNPEIRTLVEVTTHSDFNAMINRAITTERNRKSELSERKRRFESKKPQQMEKFQRLSIRLTQAREARVHSHSKCTPVLSRSQPSQLLLRRPRIPPALNRLAEVK
jgi:hypothetical protein